LVVLLSLALAACGGAEEVAEETAVFETPGTGLETAAPGLEETAVLTPEVTEQPTVLPTVTPATAAGGTETLAITSTPSAGGTATSPAHGTGTPAATSPSDTTGTTDKTRKCFFLLERGYCRLLEHDQSLASVIAFHRCAIVFFIHSNIYG
jgi:hypothetical protein